MWPNFKGEDDIVCERWASIQLTKKLKTIPTTPTGQKKKNDKWKMTNEKWQMKNDKWKMTNEKENKKEQQWDEA